ncbi:fasciclin domain-containing protein [Pedobacter jeongneungensis]|uniref:Fasciclin domain-containing protein n=2 Tax=Sphingobacteriaceae TaxID=84566 RepID=A0ABP8BPC9_9SPHI
MICAALLLLLNACKRDEYYIDGGRANPDYPGNMLQYLQAKKVPFDTVAQIVKLAGMEKQFTSEDFTFFAFDDDVVRRTIGTIRTGGLNTFLFYTGKDTVKTLDQIPPAIWKKYLQRYMFKGVNRLKDYPQIDLGLRSIYPGALYYDYNNSVANIGVNFSDANGVKYIGYRQLVFSYIPDVSKPNDNWITVPVASSDIKPTNGVVHSLSYTGAYLGFSQSEFWNDVFISGLLPGGSK